MIVDHNRLYKIDPKDPKAHYNYSNLAEAAVAKLLGIRKIHQPAGYHPEYDFEDAATAKTYEIKFSLYDRFHLEFRQSDTGYDSGIMLSKADFWVIIQPGKSIDKVTNESALTGKVRVFTIETMWNAFEAHVRAGGLKNGKNYCEINPWPGGNGEQHTWTGDVSLSVQDRMWDLSRYTKTPYKAQTVSFKRDIPVAPTFEFDDIPF